MIESRSLNERGFEAAANALLREAFQAHVSGDEDLSWFLADVARECMARCAAISVARDHDVVGTAPAQEGGS